LKSIVLRAALAAALALAVATADAAPRQTERSKQKAIAEKSRAGIQQKLARLKKDIDKTEAEKESAEDALAESEEAISEANRSLRDLAQEQADTNRKLAELEGQRGRLLATIDQQKQQIARLLKEHYVSGNEDRIKLLLSGDDPNRINRDLQLMAYVSKAQAKLLDGLRQNLAKVETNQQETQNAKDELQEIADEQQQQKATLEKEKTKRTALLGNLSKKLVAQRKEAGNLERDEKRLSALVDNLAKIIKEQQEAAAAAAKKRAEELAARKAAQAERERLAKLNAKPGSAKASAPFKVTDPIDDVKDPSEGKEEAAQVDLGPVTPDGSFEKLKGQLRSPVAGQLVVKFGTRRSVDEVTFKGDFLKAPEGTDVHAVAAGRVVFADFMRGFGNMVVVDHGNDYWTIYAYMQSRLKRAGDAVKGGEAIGTAGNTGGAEQSGLYFEVRHKGRPLDPASFVRF
jgi:septal ring factor EnvC (AmiA/AmiB activator)